MSLINQMLKDLEARSAPQLDEHRETIQGVTWVAGEKKSSRKRILLSAVMVSLLCTGIAAGSYYHLSTVKETQAHQAVLDTSNTNTTPTTEYHSQTMVTEPEVVEKPQDRPRQQNIDQQPSAMETRKMLAALVARGILDKQVEVKQQPPAEKVIVRPPAEPRAEDKVEANEIEVAVADTPQQKQESIVQKKLRPLDNSKRAEMAYQQGYEQISRGQQEAGEIQLRRALQFQADHTRSREMLAVLYLQQQRLSEASEVLTQGMKLAPNYLPFREIYARALMAQNQLPSAIAMLKERLPDINRHPNYHALLAGLYQQNQQHEQAAATYLKLVKKNSQQSRWWLGLGISLEKMQKSKEAVSAYQKARELKLPARLMKYVEARLQELEANGATIR